MNNKNVIKGIKKEVDGTYTVDTIKIIDSRRIHIYSSNHKDLLEAKYVMDQLIKEKVNLINSKNSNNLKFKELIDNYFLSINNKFDYKTIYRDKLLLDIYFNKYYELDINYVFNYDLLEDIYNNIIKSKRSNINKNRLILLIHKIIDYALNNKYISNTLRNELIILFKKIECKKNIKSNYIMNKEEVNLLFNSIDNILDKLIFTLFYELGINIDELLGLCIDCIDNNILITKYLLKKISNKDYVLIPNPDINEYLLDDNLINLFNDYFRLVKVNKYIFRSNKDINRVIDIVTIKRHLRKYINKLNLNKDIIIYSLRKAKLKEELLDLIDINKLSILSNNTNINKSRLLDLYKQYCLGGK